MRPYHKLVVVTAIALLVLIAKKRSRPAAMLKRVKGSVPSDTGDTMLGRALAPILKSNLGRTGLHCTLSPMDMTPLQPECCWLMPLSKRSMSNIIFGTRMSQAR